MHYNSSYGRVFNPTGFQSSPCNVRHQSNINSWRNVTTTSTNCYTCNQQNKYLTIQHRPQQQDYLKYTRPPSTFAPDHHPYTNARYQLRSTQYTCNNINCNHISHMKPIRNQNTMVKTNPLLKPPSTQSYHQNNNNSQIINSNSNPTSTISTVIPSNDVNNYIYRQTNNERNMTYNENVISNVTAPPKTPAASLITRTDNKKKDVDSQRKYACDTCGKRYKHLCNLKSHSKIHTDQALICPHCNKRFGRKANYKEHLRVHTGETPYQCTYCQRRFRHHHSWKDHVRIHTGEKPYQCNICHKKFKVGHNLTVHRRIHTGEKPYSCRICAKSFRQKSAINCHIKRVHK